MQDFYRPNRVHSIIQGVFHNLGDDTIEKRLNPVKIKHLPIIQRALIRSGCQALLELDWGAYYGGQALSLYTSNSTAAHSLYVWKRFCGVFAIIFSRAPTSFGFIS